MKYSFTLYIMSIFVVMLMFIPHSLVAQWSNDSTVNTPLVITTEEQGGYTMKLSTPAVAQDKNKPAVYSQPVAFGPIDTSKETTSKVLAEGLAGC